MYQRRPQLLIGRAHLRELARLVQNGARVVDVVQQQVNAVPQPLEVLMDQTGGQGTAHKPPGFVRSVGQGPAGAVLQPEHHILALVL